MTEGDINWETVARIRDLLGMTQQRLSAELGVHLRTIQNWESHPSSGNHRAPSKEHKRKLLALRRRFLEGVFR